MASDDRIDNVKLLLGQAVGLSLYTEPSKVQEELKLYEEIRAITAIGVTVFLSLLPSPYGLIISPSTYGYHVTRLPM